MDVRAEAGVQGKQTAGDDLCVSSTPASSGSVEDPRRRRAPVPNAWRAKSARHSDCSGHQLLRTGASGDFYSRDRVVPLGLGARLTRDAKAPRLATGDDGRSKGHGVSTRRPDAPLGAVGAAWGLGFGIWD